MRIEPPGKLALAGLTAYVGSVIPDEEKETDDVSGPAKAVAALAATAEVGDGDGPPDAHDALVADAESALGLLDEADLPPEATAEPPPEVAELAAACVRFVTARYTVPPDFTPETLSLVDQWLRDARAEVKERPETVELVQSAAGAYLGEVVRRAFGATWKTGGEHGDWRLCMATVYCAFNPIGMAREALLLDEAEGWHAHFELDPGEKEGIEARLAALPEVRDDEYYAPSTRFDVVNIVVDALRERMRSSGLGDVKFGPEDYA
jgi:hypothetical protein